MPGLDFFSKRTKHRSSQHFLNVKVDGKGSAFGSDVGDTPSPSPSPSISPSVSTSDPDVYYNARLDPQNYLEGPLSWNPSTRLRQMLARPGIVVRTYYCVQLLSGIYFQYRSPQAFAMVLVHDVRLKPASTVYIRGRSIFF